MPKNLIYRHLTKLISKLSFFSLKKINQRINHNNSTQLKMAVFVVSRLNVGFFGYISGKNLGLFLSNSISIKDSHSPCINILNVDKFSTKGLEETNTITSNEDCITCGTISNCGSYIAVSDDRKLLYIWQKVDEEWIPSSCRKLSRKAFKLLFTNAGTEVLVVDRGGDVLSFDVNKSSEVGKIILGHICIILDMVITENDSHVITCDRDGKIRVSMYPNSYNIVSYCFGHDEFVSSLQLVGNKLISGSGDGTFRFWNYESGEEVFYLSVLNDIKSKNETKCAVRTICFSPMQNIIAVLLQPQKIVSIYKIGEGMDSAQPVQCIECQDVPLDVMFDCDGCLWIWTSCESQHITLYQCHSQESIQFDEIEEATKADVVLELNKNWPKTFRTVDIDMTYLYKNCHDYFDEEKTGHCKLKKAKTS